MKNIPIFWAYKTINMISSCILSLHYIIYGVIRVIHKDL